VVKVSLLLSSSNETLFGPWQPQAVVLIKGPYERLESLSCTTSL